MTRSCTETSELILQALEQDEIRGQQRGWHLPPCLDGVKPPQVRILLRMVWARSQLQPATIAAMTETID